jgi:hypothetical protein
VLQPATAEGGLTELVTLSEFVALRGIMDCQGEDSLGPGLAIWLIGQLTLLRETLDRLPSFQVFQVILFLFALTAYFFHTYLFNSTSFCPLVIPYRPLAPLFFTLPTLQVSASPSPEPSLSLPASLTLSALIRIML